MRDTVSRRAALRLMGGAVGVVAGVTGGFGSPARALDRGRVDGLVRKLTLDEKISLLHGANDPASLGQAGYVPGVKRLGIPPLRLADGPAGVRVTRHATALPAPVLLASAFDPELARRYGQVIGQEGRALGQDVLLSPMVNLIRTPYAGRNFETFSEDPLLSSDLVAAEITGIQGAGLIATVKHYALNNQEKDRGSVDVRVDEQTLHECELRGFEAAVEAGTGAVMGAYNKVDGTFACENKALLTGILRERWGFDGFVMTDWDAAHSTVAALTAGLDMEMPEGKYFGAALKAAVADGSVPERDVDRAVRRVLTVMDRFGLLAADAPPRPRRDPQAGAAVALEVAKAGATLLRNAHDTLPLRPGTSVAVIGPTGSLPSVSGGGSAHVVPDHATSPLDTITSRAGNVTYALGEDLFGTPVPAAALRPALAADGHRVAAGQDWSYDGTLTVTDADEWTFVLHFSGDPVARPTVHLDGAELFPLAPGYEEYFVGGVVSAAPDGMTVRRATLHLTPGSHPLRISARGGDSGRHFRLHRITRATRARDVTEAAEAARAADTVVLFAYEDATEGRDRARLALPGNQERLIAAVTEANPRTTVVLNTSSATSMPWLERTGAVLQMYYPGQEGAEATAAVLYGECDPGGRLTQSFPVDDDHHPVAGDRRRYPGRDGVEEYSEGIHLGYRWYDAEGVRPLFPFGHGLSYTAFTYEELSARAVGQGIEVSLVVRNTGARAGIAVPQVYIGPSERLRLEQAVRVLGGYRRLALGPGERRRVSVRVDARTLSSWDPHTHDRVLGTGPRTVWAGASAGDLRLRTSVEVGG
ncbi:beta-glucosidase [Streptomyces sp. NPDC091279]|uniref:beta-glucosidase n=1 Tax=unclassified Streptomyces TaxID=2593676 RepID=UPI00380B9F0C